MKKVIGLITGILIFVFFKVNAQSFQLVSGTGLPAVAKSSSIWADLDNDGLNDVILSGVNSNGSKISAVYKNSGNSAFTKISIVGLPNVDDGALAVGDVNNDNLVDFVITGIDENSNFVCTVFKNNGSLSFTPLPLNLTGVAFGSISLKDFNNDGLQDIIYFGQSVTNKIFKVYQNTGNNSFQEIQANIEGVSDGGLITDDLNNDSFVDILINGIDNNNNLVSSLYLNNRKGSFYKTPTSFTGMRGGDLASGDYNNDGYLDFAASGIGVNVEIYQNNKGQSFTLAHNIPQDSIRTLSWGDYNADGHLDLIMSGIKVPLYVTKLYHNNAGNGFTESGDSFPGLYKGKLNWVDYDNNSTLDLLINGNSISGRVNELYSNGYTPNTSPDSPGNLYSHPTEDSVVLNWSRGNDVNNNSKALSYNIYLGTTSLSSNKYPVNSNLNNGFYKISSKGSIRDTFIVIKNLPEGKYFWSVQAIDNSFQGSGFSSEQNFNVCYPISLGNDTSICAGQTLAYSVADYTDKTINWYRKNGPPVLNQHSINLVLTESDTLAVEVINSIGCNVKDTVVIHVEKYPKPDFSLGKDTSVCFGKALLLNAGNAEDSINWYSKSEGLLQKKSRTYNHIVNKTDTIWSEVFKPFGCVYYDTIVVSMVPLPEFTLGRDTSVCYNNSLTLKIEASNVTAKWYSKSENKLVSSDLEYSFLVQKSDTIWAEIKNTSGCIFRDTIIVNVVPLPKFELGQDLYLCKGESTQIDAQINEGSYKYKWTSSSEISLDTIKNPILQPSISTKYYLQVTNLNGCVWKDSVNIIVNPSTVIDLPDEVNICHGDNIQLGGIPLATGSLYDYKYKWIPNSFLSNDTISNPIAAPTETTTFTVIITTGNCKPDTASITVNVNPLPVVTISKDTTIGVNEVAYLIASGGEKYEWFTSEGEKIADIPEPQVSPQKTTEYIVKVTSGFGCEKQDTVKVIIKNEIFIPNLFSPNGDGRNDSFTILGSGVKELNFKIYNRSGLVVYETSNVEEATKIGWDGSFHGEKAEPGVYKWILKGQFQDANPLKFNGKNNGTITLIR